MRRSVLSAAVAAGLLAATPAWAGDQDELGPGEMFDEAAREVMRALELMIKSIPQYEMPEVNENGDIIIRRVRPQAEQPPRAKPPQPDGPGTTET